MEEHVDAQGDEDHDEYEHIRAAVRALDLCISYGRSGNPQELLEAIGLFQVFAERAPRDEPEMMALLFSMGQAYADLYHATGDPSALSDSARVFREAFLALPRDYQGRALGIMGFTQVLRELSELSGEYSLLEEAAQILREGLAMAVIEPLSRAIIWSELGRILKMQFDRNGEITILLETVKACRAAADAADSEVEKGSYLSNLSDALILLFVKSGQVSAAEEAVQVGRRAADIVTRSGSTRAGILVNLGHVLMRLFQHNRQEAVLREAVVALREAVSQGSDVNERTQEQAWVNLGTALGQLHQFTGDVAFLEEAASVWRAAVAALPNSINERIGRPNRMFLMGSLSATLRIMYETTGDNVLLNEALQATDQALAIESSDRLDDDYVRLLNTRSSILQRIFELTGDTAYLTDAVQTSQEAVREASDDPELAAGTYDILALGLRKMHLRTGKDSWIRESIHASRTAAAFPSAEKAVLLTNLASSLALLHDHDSQIATLEEAEEKIREAIALTPSDSLDRPIRLQNLTGILYARFRATADLNILKKAAQTGKEALAILPQSHSGRPAFLNNLGLILRDVYLFYKDENASSDAASLFMEAAKSGSFGPHIRVNAYRAFAALSPTEALPALEEAVILLAQVAPESLPRMDREHWIGQVNSLPGEAAAAAVAAGNANRAVELLEMSRGFLSAEAINARSSEIDRLRAYSPQIAAQISDLRSRMDEINRLDESAGDYMADARNSASLAQMRRDAFGEWDSHLRKIRKMEGFRDFFLPRKAYQILNDADGGPVIFPYASSSRCDALILAGNADSPVSVVSLEGLKVEDVNRQAVRLRRSRHAAATATPNSARRAIAESEIFDVLEWLWDVTVEPVLDVLGYRPASPKQQSWPRVWWCPVGAFGQLPLHAAGYHREYSAVRSGARTAIDRVVSSYATTIRGLAYARRQMFAPEAAGDCLIIAVPDAPGASPLPGVTSEAQTLLRIIPGARLLPRPIRSNVLAALPNSPIAHFACHGYADPDNPADSRLLLYDHDDAPLTVKEISSLHLAGGLAYLSACDANVTSRGLADEAIHITGAFHLAGYQHVIGTLWPIEDASAQSIASEFYGALTNQGTELPDIRNAARALHFATRKLRDSCPEVPSIWAPYTHTGILLGFFYSAVDRRFASVTLISSLLGWALSRRA